MGVCVKSANKDFKTTQEGCAAQCTSRADCGGWAYLLDVEPTFSRPRCYLWRVMCKEEALKEFEGVAMVSYYKTKGTETKVSQKSGTETKVSQKSAGAGAKNEHKKKVSHQAGAGAKDRHNMKQPNNAGGPKILPVPGYTERKGDCGGSDIANIKVSPRGCGDKCTSMPKCKGFLYVHKAEKGYPWNRCWLKSKICSKPTHPRGQILYIYTKQANAVQSAAKKAAVQSAGKKAAVQRGETKPGAWSFWSAWSTCQPSCGQNIQRLKARTCNQGRCAGSNVIREKCPPKACGKVPLKAAKPVTRVSEVKPQDMDTGRAQDMDVADQGIKEKEEEKDDNVPDAEAKSIKSKLEEVKKNPKDNIVLIVIMVAAGLLVLFILHAFCMKKKEGPPPISPTPKPPTCDED